MYASDFTEWSAARMGPRRDVVGELATAVRAEGLTFGVSSHRVEHWWFFDQGKTFDSDVRDPTFDALLRARRRSEDVRSGHDAAQPGVSRRLARAHRANWSTSTSRS